MNENSFYIIIVVVVVFVFTVIITRPKNNIPILPEMYSNIVQLTNAERVKNGLNVLSENVKLDDVAMNYALEMNKFQFQSHVSPTGLGPLERVRNGGVVFSGVGENLAWGPATDRDAIDAWMQSAGHRRNILDPRWTQMGAAVLEGNIFAWGSFPVKYYVQIFIF